ncbi:MAG: fibronectin type III domain-containing protein [Bacteroidales bacterium]|nr:fibronectin type III domain-containing protein [Bacteroidales bacterium]
MKKYNMKSKSLKKIVYIFVFFLGCGLVGCSEPADEITDIEYARAFSPFELTARVRNQINVELNWVPVKADSYVIEVFENDSLTFSQTPKLTFKDVKSTDIPFTIYDLNGNTPYSFRVKAILSGAEESKWSGVFVKTLAENIFLPFEDTDIQANSVTLRWTPTPNVTKVTVEVLDGQVIEHVLTAEEITSGTAVINGLTGETDYIAKVYKDNIQRGRTTFTSLIDVGNAIPVEATDDFIAMLANANSGDVFALFPGTYGESSKFVVPTNVEIKAVYPNDKPIIQGCFTVENNSSLLLKDLVIDGAGLADGNQAIVFVTSDANYGEIKVDGCEIKNHVKGVYYLNVEATVDALIINNTIIHDIQCSGGDFMDNRKGAIKELTFTNNTVYGSAAARDFIRYDNTSAAFPDIAPVITIDNNTLDGIANNASKRILYVRLAGATIYFRNNIVSNTVGNFSNQSTTPVPTFLNNNYFNAPALFSDGSDVAKVFDDSASDLDPEYAAPASGNFKVSNQTIIDNAIGDPRWLK